MITPAHEHEWTNGPTMRQSEVSYSPCSTADDHLWDWIVQVQTCGCGKTRRLVLGYENRRRRGDDARRARGLRPLGTPLQASAVFETPRLFR